MKTLYEVLGVSEPNPTLDEVTLAYEEIENQYKEDPSSVKNIEEVRYAYEIFTDPIQATLYVNYGYEGLLLVAPFTRPYLDSASRSFIDSLLSSPFFNITLVIIFAAFVSVRVDGIVQWTWAVVFIPAWIISGFFLFIVACGLVINTPMIVAALVKSRNHNWFFAIFLVFFAAVQVVLFVLFEIFIVKKLDHGDRTAVQVFIPYFIIEGSGLLVLLVVVTKRLVIARRWWMYGDSIVRSLIRISLAVLIPLRIDGTIQCSWFVVFIPTYVYGAKKLVEAIAAIGFFLSKPDKATTLWSLWRHIVFYTVMGALAYTFLGLLAARLDGREYLSMPIIFIPLFIGSVLFCFFAAMFSPVLTRAQGINFFDPTPIHLDEPNYGYP